MPYTSEITRGRIIGMWECGSRISDIANAVQRSQECVRFWIHRFQEEGEEGLKNKQKPGVPRKTSREEDQELIDANRRDPFASASSLGRTLHLPVSARTIRKRLHAAGIHHRRPVSKEALKDAHRDARMAFCLEYMSYPANFWETVVWTDEKVFTSDEDGRVSLWRPDNTRFFPEHVVSKRRSGRISVAFWGWMTADTIGELVEVSNKMNSDEYIEVLEGNMLPTVRTIYPAEEMPLINFVQDNSSVHTSATTREWFAHHPEVNVIDWPAKSPDLNPIEHVWAIMVRDWDNREERTAASLRDHVREVWESIRRRPRICSSLVQSMPRRIDAVIDSAGWWTKF